MKLIADSGSTKCDWMIVGNNEQSIAKTIGFNPFFHSQDFIISRLKTNNQLMSVKNDIEEIYYYGAGCSSANRNQILINALTTTFSNASVVSVKEDLDGAAYATTGNQPGIVCIIGTGSNSCYFDGVQVHSRIPALGYVLGDEASGSYFGKILLSTFLYGLMPTHLTEAFYKEYRVDKESILFAVYNRPNANVYLASFMKFASAHQQDDWIKTMIYDGLRKFAEIHIISHPEYTSVPVSFVGSIAHYFKDELTRVAHDLGFSIGRIVKKPIDGLAAYHNTDNIEA